MSEATLLSDPESSCTGDYVPETDSPDLYAECLAHPSSHRPSLAHPRHAVDVYTAISVFKMQLAMAELARQNKALAHRIERLEGLGHPVQVSIQTLSPLPVEVTRPILALVQQEEGAFVASFVDANINASGESQLEAVEMLKDVIASTFQVLLKNEQILCEEPKRQLAVLRHFIRIA